MGKPQGFHNHTDASHAPHENFIQLIGSEAKNMENFKREWKLSYRFYPHFHPFVPELIKKLIEGSVHSLQSADTMYTPLKDGTMVVLPDSTLVSLESDLQVENQKISAGTKVYLPDGTGIKIDDGTAVTLPGTMVVTESRGMRFTLPDGTVTDVSNGHGFTVGLKTSARLQDGRPIDLPPNTKVILQSCKPTPDLFSELFSTAYHFTGNFKKTLYVPSSLVERPYPVKDLDFSSGGAYSVYNWELFYHVPLTIAIHLSKNQRFEEAQNWFHYIFDPTDASSGPTPERFWKVKPFQYTDVKKIEEILVNLSYGADPSLWLDTVNSIEAWKESPFRPHLIARYRQTAYMFKTVTAYLDNLIDWGDFLYRQDTGESINEATQIYVLAANILGQRPQAIPKKGSVRPQTYSSIRKDLDEFSNALVKLESDIPFDLALDPAESTDSARISTLSSIGNALYFCVPRNDKLMSYWDTVADRLFKIRNSFNIQGIFRQLPLFEPPIDPALLAKAAAAGLDVGAIISGLSQPLPLVRFQFLVQKAAEICQEVKSLGNGLLSAIEKEDNEALAILRAKHERVILGLAETIKYSQFKQATKTLEGLQKSLDNAIHRYKYYERLLGKAENEITIPEQLGELDTAALEKMDFKMDEPSVEQPTIEVDIVKEDTEGITGGKKISSHEFDELKKLKEARSQYGTASDIDRGASTLSLIPEFGAQGQPMGAGAAVKFGGENLSKALSMIGSTMRTDGDELTYQANLASKISSFDRREKDWALQRNIAAGDITQILKQLRAAQIGEAIAEREWKNHRQQILFAEEIERFLTEEKDGKKANKALYTWMKREIKALYGQFFQFAFDVAKRAERALQHELGDPSLGFLQFGYLAGKEGLLAGEKLYLDIKRMEMAYHELNQREYELIKHVSIHQVNPRALLELRAEGDCTVYLPEEIFDLDCPGHYFRRIKSVAVSIPSVTGPFTSVNCTLTLNKSSIRKTPLLRDGQYAREGTEDDRFSDYFGSMQSIVTSTAQNDSGLFETNLRDERYLPFEGSGVVSEWRLELPSGVRQFDYDTISDVILHIRYFAREGGDMLKGRAVENLKTQIQEAQAAGSVRLFSIRHEFPTEWAMFKNIKNVGLDSPAKLTLDLRLEHFPFWSKDSLQTAIIKRLELFAETAESVKVSYKVNATTGELDGGITLESPLGKLKGGILPKSESDLLPVAPPPLVLYFDNNLMEDLLLALTWGSE